MADKAADDHIERLAQLSVGRSSFETAWRQVRKVAAPDASDFDPTGGLPGSSVVTSARPLAAEASKDIYDVTALNAIDRLASGMEAIVTPQSEYWHGLGITDLTRVVNKGSDEELQWLENQRNLMFTTRYDADSGFVPAWQTALRRVIAFGNAFIWTEESFDDTALIKYRYMPLSQCYIATDDQDITNTWYRYYDLTAAQAVGLFKDKLPPAILRASEQANEKDRYFKFLHCVHSRADYNEGRSPFKFKSTHVAVDERKIVGMKGYYEFPVIDFRWLPEPGRIYGEGPVMRVLAEIQSANLLAKNELVASEQAVRPPLMVANAGVMNRPNTNPGAINYGGMTPQGQELIKPLFTGQRLDFATMVLEAKKNAIRESMYLNLFQLLVQNPQMSATEALIRANEKAELLGPAGSRLQGGLSRMISRELGILVRRGLWDADSAYRPPRSARGKVVVQHTSPLDRLRRAKEGEGIARLLELVAPLAQIDPEIVDNFDPDVTVREMRSILGAPVGILRTPEAVAQRRQQRAQQQAMAQNAAIAEQLAKASAQGTNALAGAKEAGIF